MRYRLRTLLILMAVGPPVLASAWMAVRFLLAGQSGSELFIVVSALTCYFVFSLGLGYAIACVINAFMLLIARLQGRR